MLTSHMITQFSLGAIIVVMIYQTVVCTLLLIRKEKENRDLLNRLMARSLSDYVQNDMKLTGKEKVSREQVLGALEEFEKTETLPID